MHRTTSVGVALIVFLSFFALFPISIIASDASPRSVASAIEDDYEAGLLDYESKIIYQLMSVRDTGRLPDKYKTVSLTTSISKEKSATSIFREARLNFASLSSQGQTLVAEYLSRPSGTYTYDSPGGYFKLHYNTSGGNAVPTADDDADGIPDYIEKVATYCDSARHTEVDILGYLPPPTDGTTGGDDKYDIYFLEMDYYGYTEFESPGPETWYDYITFIVLHRNFVGFPDNTDPDGNELGAAKVTVAHEYFHAVQCAYDAGEELWWMEAGATWMEDIVFDVVNDNYNYLSLFFNYPQTALTDNGNHAYAAFVWPMFLGERLDTVLIRQIWEECIYSSVTNATEGSLAPYGYDYDSALAEFTTWNYITGSRNDGNHYDEASNYPLIKIAESCLSYPVAMHTASASPQGYGSVYARFVPGVTTGALKISFDGNNSYQWAAYVIKSPTNSTHNIEKMIMNPSGWTSEVVIPNFENYSSVTLIGINIISGSSAASFSFAAEVVPGYAVSGLMNSDTLGYSGYLNGVDYLVTNDGAVEDIIKVSAADNLSWIGADNDTTITLAAGQDSLIRFEFQTPVGIPLNTIDELYLSARSQGDTAIFDSLASRFRIVLQHGDANFDGDINLLDILYLISYKFHGASEPIPVLEAGDMDCNDQVNLLDILDLISYVYKSGGPAPCNPI
jgi:hypothetical protein